MPIPLLDLRAQYAAIRDEVVSALMGVVDSQLFILGPAVEKLEQQVAELSKTKYAIGCANGTDALLLALRALNIGRGDEVITTPFTFFATAGTIHNVGATPVFVDIEPQSFNISPEAIGAAITPKTKAIMPIDLYGHPAAIHELQEIATRHGLVLIEDACQAHGAAIGNRKAGALGVSASFSFYPTKNMTTAEGGMVTTDDDAVAEKVTVLRQHGATQRYRHEVLGYNFRLTDIAAAIGRAQLAKLDRLNERRRRNASVLDEGLAGLKGVTTPRERQGYRHVYHQYTVRIARDRDRFQERLRDAGIGTAVHYPIPVHRQPLYIDLGYGDVSLPVAEDAAAQVLSLPVHPALSDADLDRIVETVRKVASTA